MAAGTKTVYKLDLEDIIAFPDSAHVPVFPPKPGESWVIFGQIVRDDYIMRHVYRIRDKINCEFPVAFYTDDPVQDARACKIGHILCITSGMRHQFVDGSNGYRIEDPATVFVLPCSMTKLRDLNQHLRAKSDAGEMELCNACKMPSTERCSRCETCYCSKECQTIDWKKGGHRQECPVISRLHIWNRTDWG
ncbi:hypothetical protein FB451DRAFT_1275457 [Mycena latifolia]|nr:hypothetical protein FB451DRAFT_1275457 [Mycena latifolia]